MQLTLGNGLGEFATSTVIIPPPLPTIGAILVADFNSDGKADIIAWGATTVFVVQGDGHGGGVPVANSRLSLSSKKDTLRGISVSDVNGDGILDLIVCFFERADVYLGDGKGGFRLSSSSPVSQECEISGFAAGDYNGDRKRDLAVSNTKCSATDVLLSNGKNFTVTGISQLGTLPSALVAGDFNGDGKDDLAVTGPVTYPATASLFLGGAFTLSFASTVTPPATPRSTVTRVSIASVGDFNGDQNLDLLTGYHDFFTVYWGNGKGRFSAASSFYPAPAGAASFEISNAIVADFNQDQRPDVILSRTLNGTASILLIPNVGQ